MNPTSAFASEPFGSPVQYIVFKTPPLILKIVSEITVNERPKKKRFLGFKLCLLLTKKVDFCIFFLKNMDHCRMVILKNKLNTKIKIFGTQATVQAQIFEKSKFWLTVEW